MTTFDDFVTPYGLVSKVDAFGYLDYLKAHPSERKRPGQMVLVTADTPLKASRGEGKTTTTIALVDALCARGLDAVAVLRQPSMGITAAGSKGGASGGGKSSLAHPELADWGLCGEMAAIENAQNLLVSFAEKAVDEGQLDTILVPRVSEVPSRALRQIAVDRGKANIAERVVLTPTCELMQILVLSRSMEELSARVGAMTAGTLDGQPVRFGDFIDLWRITNLLGGAVQPAMMTTQAGSTVYMHAGPFGNVSLGIPSLVSVELALARHDIVVVEAGYGADAGAQKWLDIAAREFGAPWPAAAVVVTRATTWRDDPALRWRYPFHVNRLEGLGIPAFPLVNLWEGEDGERGELEETAATLGFRKPIMGNLFRDGGPALTPQLDDFLAALEAGQTGSGVSQDPGLAEQGHSQAESLHSHKGMDLLEQLKWVADSAYGVRAERVIAGPSFADSLAQAQDLCEKQGLSLNDLVPLAVKSPATMTDDDRAPESERSVTLKKVEPHTGAGLVQVNLTTSLTTPMPKIV
ncbi:formate--tetrahydrofolate ligase [Bombiscardovia nodaiensis]|uniref:formate--tetrahydrofolate ligase n=1 Tax=Bombiscardovia nodaiensis TaxID=2932181 RepID=A0ABM8BA31_9BIFI|nr:formate--tetrahydrofolate ligase [Bombiscardovia nodaiensis]